MVLKFFGTLEHSTFIHIHTLYYDFWRFKHYNYISTSCMNLSLLFIFRGLGIFLSNPHISVIDKKKSSGYGTFYCIPQSLSFIHIRIWRGEEILIPVPVGFAVKPSHLSRCYWPICFFLFSPSGNGAEIQSALVEKSGQRTVPNVYINGEHIGGADDTTAKHSKGELLPLIQKTSHNYDYDLVSEGKLLWMYSYVFAGWIYTILRYMGTNSNIMLFIYGIFLPRLS